MNRKLIVLIAATVFTAMIQAQTLEEIIAKNIAARGGIEKIKGLKSIVMDMVVNAQGMEIPVKTTIAHNRGFKNEMTMMGMDNYMVVNNKEGFMYFPIQGQKGPEPMPEDMKKQFQESFDIQGDFIDYKEKGMNLQMQGEEDIEGTPCYKILCIKPSKSEKRYFVDKETFQIIKETEKMSINGKELEQSSEFSNFKNVDGLILAHDMTGGMGQMKAKKITVNVDIPDSFFELKKQ